MTYEELKKAYEEATKKCSVLELEKAELEKKIEEKDKALEDKDLRISKDVIQLLIVCESLDLGLTFPWQSYEGYAALSTSCIYFAMSSHTNTRHLCNPTIFSKAH